MAFTTENTSSPPVEVFALATGQLHHPDRWLFEDGNEDLMTARNVYPDYSFLIRHASGKCILFDLGLDKNLDNYPEAIKKSFSYTSPIIHEDIVDLLGKGPVPSSAIDTVIFSHLHFDHVGDCTKFPNAAMITGPGSCQAAFPGYPTDQNSPFGGLVLVHPGYRELSFENDSWRPFGPFERAHDFFGDGSLFLVDAPGHASGHLGAAARTGPDEWVFMGGDTCHHRAILMGTRPMSLTMGPPDTSCFHRDPATAQKTIELIRSIEVTEKFQVLLAHDSYLSGIMPEYPISLNGWKGSQWKRNLDALVAKETAAK
ncbi:hypothetical protein B7463_g85, partial [Scytalidium lignicola]